MSSTNYLPKPDIQFYNNMSSAGLHFGRCTIIEMSNSIAPIEFDPVINVSTFNFCGDWQLINIYHLACEQTSLAITK